MSVESSAEAEGLGGDRFVIQRRLGAGGMGVVYQALDRERDRIVAVKTLLDLDAAAMVRFKNEFRSLADVAHPNLVALHELLSVGDRLLFTMELVDGDSFLRWVRSDRPAPRETDVERSPTEEPVATQVTAVGKKAPSSDPEKRRSSDYRVGALEALDVARLRAALLQLANGVVALHGVGMLHRDLKPSNVLVTRDGLVKILDFGLVTELARERTRRSEPGLAGTVAYMSPEQGARLPLTAASDWYSIGVMLYEALTGRLPFSGSPPDILMDKQQFEPPRPRELVAGVPSDLDALCAELLRREPTARPSGAAVLRRLGGDPGVAAAVSRSSSSPDGPRLVGRETQLAALEEALRAARTGRTVVAFVRGDSGMGKTSLLRAFIDEAEANDAVVLAGRCYERESVPYKGLDSLMDALSHYLAQLSRSDAEVLMPRDVHALARLFPVLRQVEAVTAAPRRGVQILDPHELRRRAFAALRELLQRIGDRKPLVLALDDLQWGDVDSAALLAALLKPPDSPSLLLIACHRTDDRQHSPFLRELVAALERTLDVREVPVGPLAGDEALRLAQSLLQSSNAAPALAQQISTESAGNPLFIDELARHVRESAATATAAQAAGPVALDDVLRARLQRLPPTAARLLETVAVAGTPILFGVVQRASELSDLQPLAVLKAANLVRTRGSDERRVIECYHDRIRAAAVARLDAAELRRMHLRLAIALESTPDHEPEAVAVHLRGAGEEARAAEFVQLAAERANDALAFDRAAGLYRLALQLGGGGAGGVRPLRVKLGDALANAGRGPEAAEAYLSAIDGAPAAEALDLRRLAAQELLRSGHIKEGMRTIEEVLDVVGMQLPPTRLRALMALGWQRARLSLRGLDFDERDASQIAPQALTKIDAAYAVTAGLAMVDAIRGASFQAQQLHLALDAGEPHRIMRALSAEAVFVALPGVAARRRSAELVARLETLAQRLGTPTAQALTLGTTGIIAHFEGRFSDSIAPLVEAEQLFRDRCTGLAWERSTAQIFHLYSLSVLGKLRDLSKRLDQLVGEARDRGDLHAQTNLEITVGFQCRLADGQPDEARRGVAEALARWNAPDEFHIQHFNALIAEVCIDLYVGDGEAAWKRLDALERFRRVMLLRVQTARVNALWSRARAALAASVKRPELLREAERDGARLSREKVGYGEAIGALVGGSVARRKGNDARALELFTQAERRFAEEGVTAQVAALQWTRGKLIGGDEGAALTAKASVYFSTEQIRDSDAFVRFFIP
ncbi:MAG: ATPase/protein kinase family protein [Myxococcales bacterium]|nr:ATPase/protein kinase family protein [Myxococcales bacterium]